MGKFVSIFVIGLSGYLFFQNRYRLLNFVLSNVWLRRFVVGSFLNMPGMRDRMMNSVFR
ncbi:hypothetical protein ACQCT6_02140 [Cytobacillus gottheilii]|uniref:Na+/H+ antiporter n=1 Tax=Cytobacillus gottheilii TaxID=859144 RepID=A0ABX8FA52_9BACI|nr:hypothetical protein [Cytobacillus gottheilii]QVY60341.1 hypothetical protein J1899_15110 [Cytobacillus gottheilii]